MLVPDSISLPKLHLVLQVAMGWENSHLHSFSDGEAYYGEPYPGSEIKNEARVKLKSLLRAEKEFITYEYDFGDSWEHKIVLEKILAGGEHSQVPLCIGGKRACPPEDCGGIWGFRIFSKPSPIPSISITRT